MTVILSPGGDMDQDDADELMGKMNAVLSASEIDPAAAMGLIHADEVLSWQIERFVEFEQVHDG